LLHDIGKVPDDEPELPHAVFRDEAAEKYKENLKFAMRLVRITMKWR